MTDFDYDVLQKKRVAQNARRRKCGSKSRYCGLPSDHLTQKQWKERNGVCMTMNLTRPMSWEDFSRLPDSMQKEYLQHLIDTYHVGCGAIGKMFNHSQSTVFNRAKKLGVKLANTNGRLPSELQERWQAFVNYLPVNDMPVVSLEDAPIEAVDPAPELPHTQMTMVSLQFRGKIDLSMVANSLRHIIGGDADGELTVTFCTK